MAKFFSKSTGGFYSLDVHDKEAIPGDAFEITDEEWRDLLAQQERGMQIVAGTHGGPIVVEPDPAQGLLVRRDAALKDTDWLVARHRDEVELDPSQTTLTQEQYAALQSWRRTLRNITSHPSFPRVTLPERPV